MTSPRAIDASQLEAFDVHVHLESEDGSTADSAARTYFGDTSAPCDPAGVAEYYRSRRIGLAIFTVDERLSGRRHVSNDDVLRFAQANADIALAFISVDPTRGRAAVHEAERLVATGPPFAPLLCF